MLTPAQLGQLTVPPKWEVRSQISFHAPIETVSNDWGAKQPMQQPPRPNIVISRRQADGTQTAKDMLDTLLKELAQGVRGFTVVSAGEFKFDDGSVGASADITLPATPQIRALQRHVFRIDSGISSQLVATTDDQTPKKLDELAAVIKTFRP